MLILRQFVRDPGFTAAAVLTLALGIAANTSVFSLVYTVLLRPLPYKQADQVAVLWASIPAKGIPADWTSWPTIQDWRKQSKSFQDVAAELRIRSATLTGQDELEQINVGRVSANIFPLLGVQPVLGRTYTAEEEFRREAFVVISAGFWRAKFSSSPSAIGKQIEVDRKRATIVGVMPASFAFPSADTQVWLPLTFLPNWPAFLAARQSDGFRAVARLKPGVSLKQAQDEMTIIGRHLAEQYPETDAGKGIVLVSLANQMTNPHARTALWMLSGSVGLVLLIGCGNVASLLLARGIARSREFAIRAALGATRLRLIQQLTNESLILIAVSCALGLGLTMLSLRILPHVVPPDFAPYAQIGLSLPVLLFALILSVATGMLFGFVPAWHLSFAAPQNALEADSRAQAGHRSHSRVRSALVVGEFALAVLLLSGTGLLIRSFLLLQKENLGFTPENLLTATVNLPAGESSQTGPLNYLLEEALERVKTMPGVVDAAATGGLFSDYTPNTRIISEELEHSGRPIQTAPAAAEIVTERFFKTMEIPLLRGRSFSEQDDSDHPGVAVINKRMADQFWHQQNPIGKRLKYGSPGEIEHEWLTVIGVVGDMNPNGPGSKAISVLYRPYRQASWLKSMDIVVRCTAENCASLSDRLRQTIRSVNRQIPHFAVKPVTGLLAEMSAPRRFEVWLLGVFSGTALFLATVGIYGLLSYLVSQRTREIGLRMALGAAEHDVIRLILASGIELAGTGTALGLAASFFVMRLLRHLLFEVSTTDPLTMVLAPMMLLITAVAASYVPARRAAKLDPLASIRHE